MEKIILSYGQKILFPTNPIQYAFAGIGIANGNQTIMAEFIIGKYWESDTDPNSYKVKLEPVDKSGEIPYEKVYSTDLTSMIRSGFVKVLN